MEVFFTRESSNVNLLALLFLLGMSILILRGRGSAAVSAILAVAAFLPLGQQVVVFGLHFTFFRIVLMVGWARLLIKGEARGISFSRIDKLFICWAFIVFVCGLMRKPGDWAGAECLGALFDALGTYFLFRLLIAEPGEVVVHLRFFAVAAVIICLALALEAMTHKNPFFVFGGVPEVGEARDGRFRCQGPFEHPILAGTFAATLFALMVGLLLRAGQKKGLAFAGMLAAALATVIAVSSGALLTFVAAVVGFALWPMRFRMQLIRRGVVVVILALALVMKAPVWYLIARLSGVFGGTGWHRSYLIDQAVNHVSEWWLIGSSYTAHWAPGGQVLVTDPNNMDITNHYVMQGLRGGVMGLGVFIAIIVTAFKVIGSTLRRRDEPLLDGKLTWALGVCLMCHCMAFISISYFDQSQVFWLWLLSVIAVLSTRQGIVPVLDRSAQPVDHPEEEMVPISAESPGIVS
jgi:hypothetical protein